MKLTQNFSKREFDSKCGEEMPDEILVNIKELASQLQVLRDYLKTSITVNSGYRSLKHNTKVGGAKKSKHMMGIASDIVAKGLTSNQVADAIEVLISDGKMKEGGLGRYNTFTHYDIRGYKSRWDLRK